MSPYLGKVPQYGGIVLPDLIDLAIVVASQSLLQSLEDLSSLRLPRLGLLQALLGLFVLSIQVQSLLKVGNGTVETPIPQVSLPIHHESPCPGLQAASGRTDLSFFFWLQPARPIAQNGRIEPDDLCIVALSDCLLQSLVQLLSPHRLLAVRRRQVGKRLQQRTMVRIDSGHPADRSRGQGILELVYCLVASLCQVDARFMLLCFWESFQERRVVPPHLQDLSISAAINSILQPLEDLLSLCLPGFGFVQQSLGLAVVGIQDQSLLEVRDGAFEILALQRLSPACEVSVNLSIQATEGRFNLGLLFGTQSARPIALDGCIQPGYRLTVTRLDDVLECPV
jgi:hypothetical protein